MGKKLFTEKTETPYDQGYQSGRTTAIWFPIMPEKIVEPAPFSPHDKMAWREGFNKGFADKRSEIHE